MEPSGKYQVVDFGNDITNLGAAAYSDSSSSDGKGSSGSSNESYDNNFGTPEKKFSTPSNQAIRNAGSNNARSTNHHQADNTSRSNVICFKDAVSNILYYDIPNWIDLTNNISYGTNGMDYTLFLVDSSGNIIYSCYPYYIGVANPPPYIVDPRLHANIYNRLNNNMAVFAAPNQSQVLAATLPYRTDAPPSGNAANTNAFRIGARRFQHDHSCNYCCCQRRCKRPSFRFAVPSSASPAPDLMEKREDILEGLAEIKLDEERTEFRGLSEKLQKRLERGRKLKGIQSRFESNMREANNASEPRSQRADLLTRESHA